MPSIALDASDTITRRLKQLWDEHKFQFGIPIIDMQHIYLLYTFIELGIVCDQGDPSTIDQEYDRAFSNILEFTSEHFFLEADLFRYFNYPESKEHLRQHRLFIEKMKKRTKEKMEGNPEVARRLVGDLMSWLFDHILIEDKKYEQFFNKNKGAIQRYTRQMVEDNTIYITQFQLDLYNRITDSNEIINILKENRSQTVFHLWKTYDMSVKIPIIDIQHIWFLNMMVRMDRASRINNRIKKFEELEHGIRLATAYAEEHFRTEEKLMEEFHYPDLTAHKMEHAAFLRMIQKRTKEKNSGDLRAVLYMSQDLKDWLLSHIAIKDKYLLWFFREFQEDVKLYSRRLIQDNGLSLTKGQINLYKRVTGYTKGSSIQDSL